MSDLKPAKAFAQKFGVKAIVYGGPGSAKTPVCIKTSPRPVVLMSEPGFLSVRDSEAPTWPAFDPIKLKEFFDWFFTSNESKNFDTLVWDSTSQSAEQMVEAQSGDTSAAGNKAHGQIVYGIMATKMMEYINKLYYMEAKHIMLIAKQEIIEVAGVNYMRPYWAGKVLPVRVPHTFDVITRLGRYDNIPKQALGTIAFRTKEDFSQMGRDRSGNFGEYEPPNVTHLINKFMA